MFVCASRANECFQLLHTSTVTVNSFNDGKYDGNFIDQRLPRLLPIVSEFESKLFPITKAVKKRYFTNVDLENEDEFRPRYVEVSENKFISNTCMHTYVSNAL